MATEVYDYLASFKEGMNSGVDPLLIPKSQLAFAFNGTLRGDFFRQRPAYDGLNLVFPDTATETNLKSGLFQGKGYYKPDAGPESIVLQVGGRQFLITPDSDGNGAVKEITIPGDPSSLTQPQAWIEQAEQFLIFNNGLDLPVIYDGSNSRRSMGPSQLLGVVETDAMVPAVGETVDLILSAPYTGPLNWAVYIGTAVYVVTAVNSQTAKSVLGLRCLYDAATSHAAGENMVSKPFYLGWTVWEGSGDEFNLINAKFPQLKAGNTVLMSNPTVVPSQTEYQTISLRVMSVAKDGSRAVLRNPDPNAMKAAKLGNWELTLPNSSRPNVNVGLLVVAFGVPAGGVVVNVGLVSSFTGSVGDIVWFGDGQYSVESINNSPPPTSVQITVENITDTPGITIPGSPSYPTYPAAAEVTSLAELPAGRNLAYGQGRIWEVMIDGLSFLAGDIVDGNSGSPDYDYRDSVLKITENNLIKGGGLFRVPGSAGDIKAMKFVALLDVSLGQGPLQVFTSNRVFGCQAPIDRTTWATLTNPILTESLIGAGGVSQDSVSLANGDIIFRSSDGLIRSLLMARLDFNRWSNTPISREMKRVLDLEDNSLLAYSTTTVFDNRALLGTGLTASSRGIYSTSLIALNFDPISSLRGTDQSIYDGQWSGLNALQLVGEFFGGISRCFAICLSQDLTQIEISEILPSDTPAASDFDNGNQSISCYFESPVLDFGDRQNKQRNYHRMAYGEIYADEMVGDVKFEAFYKPDQWPNWVPWYSWTRKFVPPTDPGFSPRMGLPMPDGMVFDKVNNRPLREGYWFQFKLVITGKARFLGARFMAEIIPQPKFALPVAS